jgi:septal ring factor EnvC (AmiA/AmiB activator)
MPNPTVEIKLEDILVSIQKDLKEIRDDLTDLKVSQAENKRPRRKQRGIVTLFLTFHAPQGAGNLPVILLKERSKLWMKNSQDRLKTLTRK